MKVLIATGLYPPESGGPATYTKLLEDRLPALGIAVSVLAFSAVRHLPLGLRHAVYFWKCYRLARHVDIVYAQDTMSVGLPAAFAAWCAGKKFIVRVPGDHAWEQGRQRFGVTDELDEFQNKKYGWRVEFLRAVEKWVVGRARCTVVPSEYMKKIVSGWTPQPKVQVIYSSVALPTLPPALSPRGFLVVSSGRQVPWKGFEAIERVVRQEAGWRFFLATGLPREEGLARVASANVFVLNSTYEGLSHALVEAMMLGTPVVATNVGGNPELIRDGVDGLLIPPKDNDALYAALKKIESDPVAAQSRATNARERAKLFSIDKAMVQIATLLKTL